MPDFTAEWSYDPTCATSPSGAHYWMLTVSNLGHCKHCDMEQQFQAKTTTQPSIGRSYSIRGGESSARRSR